MSYVKIKNQHNTSLIIMNYESIAIHYITANG